METIQPRKTRLAWLKRRIEVLEREAKLGRNHPYRSLILDELARVKLEKCALETQRGDEE